MFITPSGSTSSLLSNNPIINEEIRTPWRIVKTPSRILGLLRDNLGFIFGTYSPQKPKPFVRTLPLDPSPNFNYSHRMYGESAPLEEEIDICKEMVFLDQHRDVLKHNPNLFYRLLRLLNHAGPLLRREELHGHLVSLEETYHEILHEDGAHPWFLKRFGRRVSELHHFNQVNAMLDQLHTKLHGCYTQGEKDNRQAMKGLYRLQNDYIQAHEDYEKAIASHRANIETSVYRYYDAVVSKIDPKKGELFDHLTQIKTQFMTKLGTGDNPCSDDSDDREKSKESIDFLNLPFSQKQREKWENAVDMIYNLPLLDRLDYEAFGKMLSVTEIPNEEMKRLLALKKRVEIKDIFLGLDVGCTRSFTQLDEKGFNVELPAKPTIPLSGGEGNDLITSFSLKLGRLQKRVQVTVTRSEENQYLLTIAKRRLRIFGFSIGGTLLSAALLRGLLVGLGLTGLAVLTSMSLPYLSLGIIFCVGFALGVKFFGAFGKEGKYCFKLDKEEMEALFSQERSLSEYFTKIWEVWPKKFQWRIGCDTEVAPVVALEVGFEPNTIIGALKRFLTNLYTPEWLRALNLRIAGQIEPFAIQPSAIYKHKPYTIYRLEPNSHAATRVEGIKSGLTVNVDVELIHFSVALLVNGIDYLERQELGLSYSQSFTPVKQKNFRLWDGEGQKETTGQLQRKRKPMSIKKFLNLIRKKVGQEEYQKTVSDLQKSMRELKAWNEEKNNAFKIMTFITISQDEHPSSKPNYKFEVELQRYKLDSNTYVDEEQSFVLASKMHNAENYTEEVILQEKVSLVPPYKSLV